jgi:hypothetical protein
MRESEVEQAAKMEPVGLWMTTSAREVSRDHSHQARKGQYILSQAVSSGICLQFLLLRS